MLSICSVPSREIFSLPQLHLSSFKRSVTSCSVLCFKTNVVAALLFIADDTFSSPLALSETTYSWKVKENGSQIARDSCIASFTCHRCLSRMSRLSKAVQLLTFSMLALSKDVMNENVFYVILQHAILLFSSVFAQT